MMIIFSLFLGVVFGGIIVYLALKPKLQNIKTINNEIEQKNQELLNTYNNKKQELDTLQNKYKDLEQIYSALYNNCTIYNTKKEELQKQIAQLKETSTKAAEDFYDQALTISQNSFDKEIEKLSKELSEYQNDAKQIYLETLEDSMKQYQNEIDKKLQELEELQKQLSIEQKNVDVAVSAAKRKIAEQEDQNFYRLVLSEEDITEIKHLREVLPYLRDKEPLNKVIYKVYYEKPYTDMVGRVLGQRKHTGIYKITNLINEMTYVGQSTDVAERWRQHVKRGVGAESPGRNKLYPAMLEYGIENFSFELLEECTQDKLNEREKYWQKFYHAQDYGYSIR